MNIEIKSEMLLAMESIASTDETRIALCGVLFESVKGRLIMVATDGRRLLAVKTEIGYDGPSVIIPRRVIRLTEGAKMVTMTLDEKLTMQMGNIVITSPYCEGNYPKWRGVVPNPVPDLLTTEGLAVNMELWHELVKALRVFVGNENIIITGGGQTGMPYVLRSNQSEEVYGLLMPVRDVAGQLGKETNPKWLL